MAVKIQDHIMPTSMAGVGEVKFPKHPKLGQAGDGAAIVASTRTATWRWHTLNSTEFDYLATTVCEGNHSMSGVAGEITTLNDPTQGRIEIDFRYGTVDFPEFDRVTHNTYYGVTLTIRDLLPDVFA